MSTKSKPSPAKTKTGKKRKELENKKTIKQLQSFWIEFAKKNMENQEQKSENSAPACPSSSVQAQQMATCPQRSPVIVARHKAENSAD